MRDLDDVLHDLHFGLNELERAKGAYEVADAYYNGDDPEIFVSDALRMYMRDSINAYRLNLASVPVDTVADRLNIASFTSPAAEAVEIIATENDLWLWANDVMRNAEKYGDYYVGVWLDEGGHPILSPLDPLTTRVVYDSELERVAEFAIRRWKEDENTDRATLYYLDGVYKLVRREGQDWEPFYTEGEAWPLPNLSNSLPIKHFRNRMPYGTPGHLKAYGVQQIITKAILNMMANVDFMGFRQRYATKNPEHFQAQGLPAPTPRTKDGVAVTHSSLRPALTSGPGKLWEIVAQSVGEFSPTDVEEFLKLLEWCVISIARATRLPVRLWSEPSGQQPSAESQQESGQVLSDLVNSRRRSFGAAWSQVLETALELAGGTGPVNVEWSRDVIITALPWWESATMAVELVKQAISTPAVEPFVRQKLMEAGYGGDEIEEFLSSGELGSLEEAISDE